MRSVGAVSSIPSTNVYTRGHLRHLRQLVKIREIRWIHLTSGKLIKCLRDISHQTRDALNWDALSNEGYTASLVIKLIPVSKKIMNLISSH